MDIDIDISALKGEGVEIDVGTLEDFVVTIGGLCLRLNSELFNRLCKEFGEWSAPVDDLQSAVVAWSMKVFGTATPLSSFKHLKREVENELESAILQRDRAAVAEEAADIVLLLLHITGRWFGINLMEEVRRKFEINQRRRWGKPDADGVVEHIRE